MDDRVNTAVATDTAAMATVAGEGILIAGGARAILLQIAHPAIGQGVADYSRFSERAMDRLRATLTYVYCMAYGSAAERRAVADRVDAVHRHIHGPGYDARNPALQLWVTATLYDTALTLYERWIAPLDDGLAEEIYREYRILGTALQMSDAQWPADRPAFRAYWNTMIASLEVTDAARGVCKELLYPRRVPPPVRAAMPLNRLVTAALLPPHIRAAYGLEWNPRRQRRFRRFSRTVRAVYPHLPASIRQLPKSWYLRDMRRRLARDGGWQ